MIKKIDLVLPHNSLDDVESHHLEDVCVEKFTNNIYVTTQTGHDRRSNYKYGLASLKYA